MNDVSWLGVVVGAIALFALGGVWYTVLFGRAYREELGVPDPAPGDAPQPPPVRELGGQLIAGLVMTLVLAGLIGQPASVAAATLVGVGAGVLVAAALGQFWLFEGRSVRHLAINVGYVLVGLSLVGAILGAFQAA